jgi:hypothetical protein
MEGSHCMSYTVMFCEFCKTRKDLKIHNDRVFGSIQLCHSCSQDDIIESKRVRALETQRKMNEIQAYISKSLKNYK